MLKNYIVQSDLSAYVPNIDELLFDNQLDYSSQIAISENEILNDFYQKKYDSILLRDDLTLDAGTSAVSATAYTDSTAADTLNRLRWVLNFTSFSGDEITVILQGRNDEDDEWVEVKRVDIDTSGQTTYLISPGYKYYRLRYIISDVTTFTVNSFMTETSYDLLFIYKILYRIHEQLFKEIDDQYYTRMKLYEGQYNKALNSIRVTYDSNDETFTRSESSIKFYK